MTIYEFGKENEKTVLLVHPSLVMWDYFDLVIPLLEKKYHVIVPALPGYDEKSGQDFTSVEEIADALSQLSSSFNLVYGCSMGGAVVVRMLGLGKVPIQNAVIDGGITPYQMPKFLTVFPAVRDFLMVSMGKWGGKKLLMKAFDTDVYSEEDMEYVEKVFRFISLKTIWRTFYSTNNYDMPRPVPETNTNIEYWFADVEEKSRKLDIQYIKQNFPKTRFVKTAGVGHGGLAPFHPQKMADMLEELLDNGQAGYFSH